jgi:hypothetical protein
LKVELRWKLFVEDYLECDEDLQLIKGKKDSEFVQIHKKVEKDSPRPKVTHLSKPINKSIIERGVENLESGWSRFHDSLPID